MTKKKKTFRKFINEEILKIEPPKKGKEFGSFKEFVNDVKGYQPPEKPELQTETFKEFVDKTKGPEKNFVPDYINPTQKQIEEINKRRIIEEINEVLKYRDPVLNKMSFQEWLKIPQNFFVFELSNEQAKRLYEQDMSRVEKYEELKKKSGGGKIKVTTEDPFTPADLLNAASPDGVWYDSTDATKNTLHSNNGISQWDESAGKTAPITSGYAAHTVAPTTFPNSAATRGFSGAAKTSGQSNGIDSGNTSNFTLAAGNPWTVGWVLHIPQSTVDLTTGGSIQASIGFTNAFSVGYRTDTDVIWADQRTHYDQFKWIRKTGVTAGTYIIIGTQDGTASGLKLYVNGVDQGVQNSPGFGYGATGFQVFTKNLPEVIIGDILVMERALTPAEVTILNNYWTAKFI